MAKVYDIVETSKMAMESTGSLIDVVHVAKTDLENGRLVAVDADGTVRYAKPADTKVFLHTSVEKMPELFRGLTEFKKVTGDAIRMVGMMPLDRFASTAIEGTVVKGDVVGLKANSTDGRFSTIAVPAGTENFLAKVVEVMTLGYDRIPAIKVEVIKA
jgi:hypothetical protein